ncbi:MAG: glycoside hydrolase family 43 protein [Acidimicrobiales bacterium]
MRLRLFNDPRPFPGQDPWIVPFEGDLLLVESVSGDRAIAVSRFADLTRMHRRSQTVIWTPPSSSDHGRELWAPQLHHIGATWYVYYAASDGASRNHRTYALEADHPLGPYRDVGKVCDPLHDVWAIDLTVLRHDSDLYAVWSGWDEARDGAAQNLYIAPMADPGTIGAPRHCLSRPEYFWEMSVAPVNEGPTILRNPQGRLFIVFSADASWSPAYKLGLLEWVGGDITSPSSWVKLPRPVFVRGGHGCVVQCAGEDHLVYHRKMTPELGWDDREIRVEPVSWDTDGYPTFGALHRSSERPEGGSRSTQQITLAIGFPRTPTAQRPGDALPHRHPRPNPPRAAMRAVEGTP